ncbi:methylated-DNA--[protein]-cysteine S-methyltransferase [Sciscionella sediminilitoris]|uniref:methylated-DNA--[protein]-cysteine S-methyltransferase n=1 Tax=Sciscionella sediminilitoris TaxID=1445613 RepID=UPI00068BAD88|nr:methylated-DNA--[protein]-cysteine S-methyltransferase [Sciscionella sp. SE31]
MTADKDIAGMLAGDETEALARLRARLAEQAASAGVLDIAYRTHDTPVGRLLLAATEAGVLRVAYEREEHERVLASLADTVSPRILHAPGRLDRLATELDEYFTGKRRSFDVPLDLRLSKGFRREVLGHLRDIGYGETASYAGIAAAAGSPRAVRAAGSACATNPIPVVLPCHRVLRSDGSLSGYVGGVEAKRKLLELEAA